MPKVVAFGFFCVTAFVAFLVLSLDVLFRLFDVGLECLGDY